MDRVGSASPTSPGPEPPDVNTGFFWMGPGPQHRPRNGCGGINRPARVRGDFHQPSNERRKDNALILWLTPDAPLLTGSLQHAIPS
ncbi:hypothetical protein EYF80_066800 [Liparis tanakae]|uniref:Uncharacterized protein n=1 Tax=Liparis tanakae TaxID=230148 RepID=A0A4Z2E2X6_9TELE|nr:hypothetical protein EYF80_066800 [Liparis tanakae]